MAKAKPELAAAAKRVAELQSALQAAQTAGRRSRGRGKVGPRLFRPVAGPGRTARPPLEGRNRLPGQDRGPCRPAGENGPTGRGRANGTGCSATPAKRRSPSCRRALRRPRKKSEAAAAGVKQAQDLVAQLTADRAANLRQAGALDALLPALNETLGQGGRGLPPRARRCRRHDSSDGDQDPSSRKKTNEQELMKKAAAEKPKAIEAARNQIPTGREKARRVQEGHRSRSKNGRGSLGRFPTAGRQAGRRESRPDGRLEDSRGGQKRT